jgi:transposase
MYSVPRRHRIIIWWEKNGRNYSATARQFKVARSTLYRWLSAYDPARPGSSLARGAGDRPRPKEAMFLQRMLTLHLDHPRWGRRKLREALLRSHPEAPSEASIGRWLAEFVRSCPICRGRDGNHSAASHAIAKDLTHYMPRLSLRSRRRRPTGLPQEKLTVEAAEFIIRRNAQKRPRSNGRE